MRITIKDFKAPSLNKSYAGRHWSKRKDEADLIHTLVWAAINEQKISPITKFPVDIYVTAYYKYKHRRDGGNVSEKELVDGLVMSKILPDDDTKHIRWSATRAIIGAKEDKVIIDIREIL
ncbi:MAG: hypothetical protein U9O94_06460 [Nanoarchaeota archaeon]|nr:hypothetical protein [Nanoarchaeota archaeon]